MSPRINFRGGRGPSRVFTALTTEVHRKTSGTMKKKGSEGGNTKPGATLMTDSDPWGLALKRRRGLKSSTDTERSRSRLRSTGGRSPGGPSREGRETSP